jgi:hypothetical protein
VLTIEPSYWAFRGSGRERSSFLVSQSRFGFTRKMASFREDSPRSIRGFVMTSNIGLDESREMHHLNPLLSLQTRPMMVDLAGKKRALFSMSFSV